MRIQHNIMGLNSYRQLGGNNSALAKNLEKLSSGYRINRAGDDAAGLAISEKMRAQIKGLEAAQKNANDGISLVQTAEGALTEVHSMLNRMTYLATQSANGTYDNEVDRANLDKEFQTLKTEIDRIAKATNFNGISLLDGNGGVGRLSKLPVEYNTESITNGVTIDDVQNGAGTKGTFTIDITKKFSVGDTLAVTYTPDGDAANVATVTLEMQPSGTPATAGNPVFSGDTIEEQAQSIANALTGKIGGNFDITADGGKISIVSKVEGTEKAGTIESITATDSAAIFGANTAVAGDVGTATKPYIGAFEVIGGKTTGGAGNIEEGTTLTFKFTDARGKDLEVDIKATAAMADSDAAKATLAIVDALNKATFKDNKDTTGVDESQMKVSDLFTFTANMDETIAAGNVANGTIRVEGKDAITAGKAGAVGFVINKNGSKNEFAATQGQASTANTTPKVSSIETGELQGGFTAGDKFKIAGTLADGRSFEIMLEAGKDFEIDDATPENTLTNIKNALESDKVSVKLTAKDGSTSTLKGSDLFDATKGEFKVTVDAANKKLKIESANAGTAATHTASEITTLEFTGVDPVDVTLNKELAQAQGPAQSSFTFDGGLEYGTAIKVGDKTYEIVKDARDTVNRNNIAVVVDDLKDSAAVAKAVAEKITANEKDYTADYTGSTVTVSSKGVGSDQKALSVSMPYGDKVTTASFAFDPKAVKDGSVLTFNGQKYQFVEKGKSADEGAVAIEIADFSKATSKELGEAFLDVLNNGTGTIAEDGTITLKSNEVDGKIADPSIKFDNYLRLQIGDTAADYNQLNVKLSDMHTEAMGLADTDIATIDTAAAAIDKIKSAINYVSDVRGDLGAIQNRLEHTINNLGVQTENITAAESRIRDTDMAEEMMAYTKNNILVQAAQAMLAQANQVPQGILQLLQ